MHENANHHSSEIPGPQWRSRLPPCCERLVVNCLEEGVQMSLLFNGGSEQRNRMASLFVYEIHGLDAALFVRTIILVDALLVNPNQVNVVKCRECYRSIQDFLWGLVFAVTTFSGDVIFWL
jgi:hypothetical protein